MTEQEPASSLPTALVVEDDEHIGRLLQFMLQRAGLHVVLASDGRAAQAYLETQPAPAIALFDVMVPYVDGLELLGLARRQPGWQGVPVLMLTAKAQDHDIARGLAAGATDYITKPFQPEQLLARIRGLIQASGSSK